MGKNQRNLNKSSPVNADVKLGNTIAELIAGYNDLALKYNSLLAKLDGDAGVTDANYTALLSAESTDITDIESR